MIQLQIVDVDPEELTNHEKARLCGAVQDHILTHTSAQPTNLGARIVGDDDE